MERPSRDQTYIDIASVIAKRGTCGRLQVGAVITQGGRIISTGYNGPLPNEPHCSSAVCDISQSCVRAVHAEMNAILFSARHGIATEGATLYCTYSPCINCARAIVQAGIKRVVFKHKFRTSADGLETLIKNKVNFDQVDEDNIQNNTKPD